MNASFAPERRVYAANGGQSRSQFSTNFSNILEQQQLQSDQRNTGFDGQLHRQRRVSGQVPIEPQLPRSLNSWYNNQVSITGEYFLSNLQNDWKDVHNDLVVRRNRYVAAIRREGDDNIRILELRQAYVDNLWGLMTTFYDENRDVIDSFQAVMASKKWIWINIVLEWNLEVTDDYKNYIDPSLSIYIYIFQLIRYEMEIAGCMQL